MIHSLTMLVSLSVVVAHTGTSFTMSGPKEAKTTATIVACAEKDDVQGGLRSKPHVFSAGFRSPRQRAFVAWYNPYSGRTACHVYVYIYDGKKKVWVRKVARIFDGTPQVSIEFSDAITIRDVKGKVIYRYRTE